MRRSSLSSSLYSLGELSSPAGRLSPAKVASACRGEPFIELFYEIWLRGAVIFGFSLAPKLHVGLFVLDDRMSRP